MLGPHGRPKEEGPTPNKVSDTFLCPVQLFEQLPTQRPQQIGVTGGKTAKAFPHFGQQRPGEVLMFL
jgi:hypothetical protein